MRAKCLAYSGIIGQSIVGLLFSKRPVQSKKTNKKKTKQKKIEEKLIYHFGFSTTLLR